MPSEPVTTTEPKYPVSALTTFELRRYRRELEHATVREELQQRLAVVLAEQEDRRKIARANGA